MLYLLYFGLSCGMILPQPLDFSIIVSTLIDLIVTILCLFFYDLGSNRGVV